jgi:Holliday junction resolvase
VSNYRHGADLEREAKRVLEENGYYVIRSAGSKGTVDLAAFKADEWLMVQCKLDGYLSPAERVRLRQLAAKLRAVPLAASWVKEGRAARTVGFAELTSMGPAGNRPWTPDHGLETVQ